MDEQPDGTTESFRESVERKLREASKRGPARVQTEGNPPLGQDAPFGGSSTMREAERERVMRRRIAEAEAMAREANEHICPVDDHPLGYFWEKG